MIYPSHEHYPTEIYVKGKRWEIWLCQDKILYGKQTVRGLCNFDERRIYLKAKQGRKLLFSTFWHELLHALEYEHKITIQHQLIYDLEGPLAALFLGNRGTFLSILAS